MQEDDKDAIVVRDGQSKLRRFPSKPSMWDHVKESFEPTGTKAMLESIRKRRQTS